ncbi:hypothetical protein NQZ68_017526 [Dissostichus eleginoides]|nr:hypothetical protein NQZ68_017526 [Dissostichus eleginoides]
MESGLRLWRHGMATGCRISAFNGGTLSVISHPPSHFSPNFQQHTESCEPLVCTPRVPRSSQPLRLRCRSSPPSPLPTPPPSSFSMAVWQGRVQLAVNNGPGSLLEKTADTIQGFETELPVIRHGRAALFGAQCAATNSTVPAALKAPARRLSPTSAVHRQGRVSSMSLQKMLKSWFAEAWATFSVEGGQSKGQRSSAVLRSPLFPPPLRNSRCTMRFWLCSGGSQRGSLSLWIAENSTGPEEQRRLWRSASEPKSEKGWKLIILPLYGLADWFWLQFSTEDGPGSGSAVSIDNISFSMDCFLALAAALQRQRWKIIHPRFTHYPDGKFLI